jgi:hypothetical protein
MAVDIRGIAAQPTACVRLRRDPDELPSAFDKYLPRIGRVTGQLKGRFSGSPFLLYHGIVDGKLDVELGMPLVAPVAGLHAVEALSEGTVGASELPGGRVAVWVYSGPYAGLGDAWADLNGWLMTRDYICGDLSWESYIDDPDSVAPDDLRTELYQLLRD